MRLPPALSIAHAKRAPVVDKARTAALQRSMARRLLKLFLLCMAITLPRILCARATLFCDNAICGVFFHARRSSEKSCPASQAWPGFLRISVKVTKNIF
jgi:hypothetical protein